MTTYEILTMLQREIHTTIFATVDQAELPQTCVIDLMLCDEAGLYFLTAKGKAFYERLLRRPFVAVCGVKGDETMSSLSISLRGWIRSIGQNRLEEIFSQNPYMSQIYPTPQSRQALEVFQIYQGDGELFDLSQNPVFRQSFSFGGGVSRQRIYQIQAGKCTGCGICQTVCPQDCISGESIQVIDQSHCLHCGNCLRSCPEATVILREVAL